MKSMALNYDLYLYFDPEDNVAKNPGEYGWAENFKRFLSIMLRQFLGRHPVFLETDLEKEADILEEVKALIFILSPASVKSPALQHILTGFKQISTRQKDIEFTNRIFKIVKFPVPLGDQPEEVRAQLPFDLYDYDPASGKTKEIENFFSQEAEMNYWMKLVDLAFDINSTLSHFEKHEHINEHVTPKRSVFLAETGPELIVQRNMIKRELLRQGYQVHPDRNLSTEAKALSEEVKDILGNCNYSIHLMGDHVAVGNEVSISEGLLLASRRCNRTMWILSS